MKKCNIFDSVEGIIVLNLIVTAVDKLPQQYYKWMRILRWSIRGLEVFTIFGDVVESSNAGIAFSTHKDFYSPGLWVGKLLKISVHFYMDGWVEWIKSQL